MSARAEQAQAVPDPLHRAPSHRLTRDRDLPLEKELPHLPGTVDLPATSRVVPQFEDDLPDQLLPLGPVGFRAGLGRVVGGRGDLAHKPDRTAQTGSTPNSSFTESMNVTTTARGNHIPSAVTTGPS
ncbi:hypothetical protein GCM10022223_41910 [Kineosporia mesophila]|uniref:Uncharacterized protein n=1 Tax=Kineosporia mesophila TaxID=566012 RepID=A0ABP6ZYB3_9ACTN